MAQNYGTRGTADEFEVNWDKFGELVIKDWQEKLLEKKIYDTGNLYRSIEYGYRATNALGQIVGRGHASEVKAGTVPDVFTFKFPMYGIYVERGVGRGYTRGNGGDLVKFKGTGRSRERRTWYYRIFANERHRLGELVAEQYGRAAASMIHTLETHRLTTRN